MICFVFFFCLLFRWASCTGCYWWLGDAGSCIQVVSFVWVLTIWYSLGLVLWYSRVLESVLPLQRLRAWSRVLRGSIYSFPVVKYSCPLSIGILHVLVSEGVFLMYLWKDRYFTSTCYSTILFFPVFPMGNVMIVIP